jgi:toxin YoeB
MRAIQFVPDAWAAYQHWHGQDKKTLKRVNTLITAALRDRFTGIGKPEPLRGDLSGYWSRRKTMRIGWSIAPLIQSW